MSSCGAYDWFKYGLYGWERILRTDDPRRAMQLGVAREVGPYLNQTNAPHALTQPPPEYRACLEASVRTAGAVRK